MCYNLLKGVDEMENVNVVLASNIFRFRKKCALSQEDLAQKLGVTFQAVSKWETAKSAPDISFLPIMADVFGCYIDELFSREIGKEACNELPWQDDDVIRGVVFEGRKLLRGDPLLDRFVFEIKGEAKNVQSECNIDVHGNVSGGCKSAGDMRIAGSVSGGLIANQNVVIGGDHSGGCCSDHSISVGGNLSGGCYAEHEIVCKGNLFGNISCPGNLTIGGDVEAEKIDGNVVCNSLKCDLIKGDVTVKKND